jgi:hypothetical protein
MPQAVVESGGAQLGGVTAVAQTTSVPSFEVDFIAATIRLGGNFASMGESLRQAESLTFIFL